MLHFGPTALHQRAAGFKCALWGKGGSEGPNGFCSLLSSVSLPNSHFTAAAQLQGLQGGPAKYLDLVHTHPSPQLWREAR